MLPLWRLFGQVDADRKRWAVAKGSGVVRRAIVRRCMLIVLVVLIPARRMLDTVCDACDLCDSDSDRKQPNRDRSPKGVGTGKSP